MLTIARALINGPDLLLLDESSDGVQPWIIRAIGSFILGQKSTGVLLAEQNIDLIQRVTERAYVMEKAQDIA